MRQLYTFYLTALCLIAFTASGQVTVTNPTNTTPNLSATYTSLANAITALNGITAISGPVTISLTAGNNQIAPAGGYNISFSASTTAATPITISGNNNTITAFTPQVTGSLTDALFKLRGADFITLQNFVLEENPLNTATGGATPNNVTTGNNMTEWGVALLCASTSNGAQNNTILNNTISLNKTYRNTFGIYSNTRHTSTVVDNDVAIINNTTAPNKNNKFYSNTISNVNMGITLIGSGVADNMDTGNDVGGVSAVTGNSISNWGGAAGAISNYIANATTLYGIYLNLQKDDNVGFNTITTTTVSASGSTFFRGILKDYSTVLPVGSFSSVIRNNTITITDNFTNSHTLHFIRSEGITTTLLTASISIINNQFLNNTIAGATTSIVNAISNTSLPGTLDINNNIMRGTVSAATGTFSGISVTGSGAGATTVNINNNQLGNAVGGAVRFTAVNNSPFYGIIYNSTASAVNLSISNNNLQGFVHDVTGSGVANMIYFNNAPSVATITNINNNTFTNLELNTTGGGNLIRRTGNMALNAGAIENCNNNSIVTGLLVPVSGSIFSMYNASSTSSAGNSMNFTGNNFSNVIIVDASIVDGCYLNEGAATGGPTKTISNNIFNNWNVGTSIASLITATRGGSNSIVSGNTISNITGSGSITGVSIQSSTATQMSITGNTISNITNSSSTASLVGIYTGAVNVTSFNIGSNIIGGFNSSASGLVVAIRMLSMSTANLFKNKVYDLNCSNTNGSVSGIEVVTASTGTFNIYNNLIGNLEAPFATNTNAVKGLNILSAAALSNLNVYYNTIYLNATSAGANFGSSGIFLTVSGTATSMAASIRNNIVINRSTANGSGLTVAYRRSGPQLNNYATSSNNNIYYAGVPSATNLIYFDGTNSDQTLGAFKTRVGATRESSSYTELSSFLSLSGASANFLHLNPAVQTLAESRAVNIATYTDDFDSQVRQGNAGYTGTGTGPDIGADELEGILSEPDPPVITYAAITTPSCTTGNISITGVIITDATGVPLSGGNRPRIYYRKNSGSWFSQLGTNTAGTATNSIWTFTIVAGDMGGITGGDTVSYYLIAQDIVAFPNVNSNPSVGLVATSVNAVSTAPTSPNIYTVSYTLSGLYTVGVGGNFATLTAAVNAYNTACALNSAVVFELINNSYPSETFPISVLFHADASAVKTLTIRPSATSTPLITGASANPIISLNAANYVSFDGRQGGAGAVKSLGISNTSGGITVQFINDAQRNTLKFCMIKGQRVSNFSGTIVFGTAGTGTGNDLNSIENNDISEAGGFSNNGIYSAGTAGKENDNISILNNNIFNYFNPLNDSHGIYINNNTSGWTISGNRFYQTATRIYTVVGIHFGIYITSGSGYNINNNIIGFANASGTGTTNMIGNSIDLPGFPASYSVAGTGVGIRYVGIGVSDLYGAQSNIDGNTVAGFAVYTSSSAATLYGIFCGIYVESGNVNVGANAGNTIGSETGTNSIYAVTTGSGGTVVGIRTACLGSSIVQNNKIGSILASGTNTAMAPAFTGISVAGFCNYTLADNIIGNATADNIQLGYALSGGLLSNAGTLNPINIGISTLFKGIISTNSGASLSITNNILRGWTMSCRSVLVTGIESSGLMFGATASVNINSNSFGTAATNWLNATVDNASFLYGINATNTGTAISNIQNNDFRGSFFGTQNGVGGGLIRFTGATSANNVSTISGNTFTNLSFRFTTGDLYFIFTNYSIASTGQLLINNNQIVGTVTATGTSQYHMVHCVMSSATGSQVNISNNSFSNVTAATGFNSDFYGIYTFFNGNPCQLSVTGNTLGNWTYGTGGAVGIEISTMTGTATCSANSITNITSQGDVEGISLSTGGSSGQFTVFNNTINTIVSSGAGGFIYGISAYLPSLANTTQTTIDNNRLNGFSSTNNIGIITGVFLDNGHPSSIVSVLRNKIYDLSGSKAGSRVYGINNHTALAGSITYANNYIGDLRAPIGNTTVPCIAGIKIFSTAGDAKVFYNSIHLNTTGSGAQFSTAAIFADAATALNLRNNILSNISTPGTSGRTVAYWRSNTSLAAYNGASNNNLFYAGTASAQKLVYYDGTNSDQTLTAYKARVTLRDNLSVSSLPAFISTTGASADFLHLAPLGNCAAASGGNNAGILLVTDYDGDSRSITSPFLTDIGADEVTKVNIWTGANSSNWNDAGNWSDGIVPNTTEINAFISNVPAAQPIISTGESYQVSNLIVQSGAVLTNLGTIKVSGGLYADVAGINTIQAGVITGSVEVNGNCAAVQQLSGAIFTGNSIKNFTVSNDVSISSLPGESLNISRELSFGAATGKTLFTGDNLVLLSTQTATANVAVISGNIISGKATVERYINTGLVADGRHLKSWQFLATPTVGQTIFESWQENGATPAGYGTWITGTGTGFDATTLLPSMKYYDYVSNAWTGVSSTAGLLNDKKGYMVYVRGDRSVTGFTQDAVPTNLRSKGTLYQPAAPPPITTVQPTKLESVGNPYASSINLVYMKNNGLFVNLDNNVTVWDPLLAGSFNSGGYQTLSAANNYEPTAGGTAYYPAGVPSPFIQSGQAFFVRSSGLAGSVTFSEDCKESSNRLVNRTSLPTLSRQFFRASLFTANGVLADGNAVVFDPMFANAVDKDDAHKISNAGENFGLMRNNQHLAVEARRPVSNTDTIYYQLSNLRKQNYQLRFAVKNMQSTGLTAWLADRYLQTNTQLSLTDSSFVNILINNDPGSYAGNRFYVLFKKKLVKSLQQIPAGFEYSKNSSLPINDSTKENMKSGIDIYPNPVENKTIQIHFTNKENGEYNCKLVNSLGQPVYNSVIHIRNGNSIISLKPGASISAGIYLLYIYDEKGNETTLRVIVR